MVAKLKQQISDLKQELALSSGEERQDELDEGDKERSLVHSCVCARVFVCVCVCLV